MSKVCEVCGKNRKFRPNIQRVYCVVNGQRKKMNVCTNCLKSGKVARS